MREQFNNAQLVDSWLPNTSSALARGSIDCRVHRLWEAFWSNPRDHSALRHMEVILFIEDSPTFHMHRYESRHSCSQTVARCIERARGHCRCRICSSPCKDVYYWSSVSFDSIFENCTVYNNRRIVVVSTLAAPTLF